MKFVYAKDLEESSLKFSEKTVDKNYKFPVFESIKEMKKFEAYKFEQPKLTEKISKKLFEKASSEEKYNYGDDYVYNQCEGRAKNIVYNKLKKMSNKMLENSQKLDGKVYLIVGEKNVTMHDTIDYIRATFENKNVAEEFVQKENDKTLHIVEDNGYLLNNQNELGN